MAIAHNNGNRAACAQGPGRVQPCGPAVPQSPSSKSNRTGDEAGRIDPRARPRTAASTVMPISIIPFPDFDPVLVTIGPFAIRWYALAYIFGILFGWVYARALIGDERNWGGPAPL